MYITDGFLLSALEWAATEMLRLSFSFVGIVKVELTENSMYIHNLHLHNHCPAISHDFPAPHSSPTRSQPPLNLPNPGIRRNTTRQPTRAHRAGHILPTKVNQRIDIRPPEGTTASKSIKLAVMPQVRRALRIRVGIRAPEQVPRVGIKGRHDVLEDIALCHHIASGDVEGVARDGVPVVVNCVQQRVPSDLWRAPRGVVDVVPLHGNQIIRTRQVNSPVMMSITRCAPARRAIKLAVGERHAVRCRFASDEHLAAHERHLDVVDPDEIGARERDGVAAPDVLRVEVRDVDVLDNHILGSIRHAESLPLNHTRRSDPDDGLIAPDIDAGDPGLVVRHGDGGRAGAGVAVRAPARLVDGVLAAVAGAGVGGGAAAGFGHAAFGADEVVFLV
ncbi:hypothetical protein V492_03540 [Pseudogymnoascus sp. VKM F-4246]|nr:hypothetical protein V492_03540 [Pseudogymnoascus sp. VKM F-4246]